MNDIGEDPIRIAGEDDAIGLGWAGVHERATAATDADVAQALLRGRAVAVSSAPHEWDAQARTLELVVGSKQGVFWKETKFFAVDADLDAGSPDNRHVLEYHKYFERKGLLILSIPDAARAGLSRAAQVRVFRSDDVQLHITRGLQSALAAATRGDVLATLWDRESAPALQAVSNPKYLPADRRMNDGQLQALSAMTSPGGFLVWGPPGTGKTTVITSAVVEALQNNRSVLITSHTNVAVDNVLIGIVEDDEKYGLGLVEPGRVIRHAGEDRDTKVQRKVVEHRHLLVDKAAAVITNREERQSGIDRSIAANRAHADRSLENRLRRELDAANVDVTMLLRAAESESELSELAELRTRLLRAQAAQENAEQRHRDTYRAYQEFAGAGERLREHDAAIARIVQAQGAQAVIVDGIATRERTLGATARIATSTVRTTQIALEPGWLRITPWIRRRRALRHQEAFRAEQSAILALDDVRARRDEAERELGQLADALRQRNAERASLVSAAEAEAVSAKAAHGAADDARAAVAQRNRIAARVAALEEQVGDLRGCTSLIDAAVRDGSMTRVLEYRGVIERVADLNAALERLQAARARLDDEYRKTREKLLAEAPVVACTLTALTFNPSLLSRRFDVVIIDEAASASASSVVYAGSRADRTLAVVGDFLQNAPINETEDPRNDDEARIAAWRTADLFELVGITDRRSAEAHPRCVALSTQYRYPPTIAEVVNRFCYDGLLRSVKPDPEGPVPVVTFIDTSRIAGRRFERVDGSWLCEASADIAIDLAGRFPPEVGFVTPYAAQAGLVAGKAARVRLRFPAGTAHRFQGQEYDTVVFDLMQDDTPRWIASADLHGTRRANSAAKLLNVALTRAKERIFLIGDWDFVRGQDSPGMRAIAELEGHPHFRLERR